MPSDPSAGGPFGGFDPKALENVPLFRELAKLMSWGGGPVNWDLARQMAAGLASRVTVAIGPDRDEAELGDAVRVAELWLDAVVSLPAVAGPVKALSTQDWVARAATSEGLGTYVEPVAEGLRAALAKGLPEELGGLGGALGQAIAPMGAMLAGMQAGTVTGHLAGQLLGTYDLGVPTLPPTVIGTVGDAAARFARDYDFEPAEFRHWLALREALHRRMFAGVPWLRPHVATLIGKFASAADFDPASLMDQLGGLGFTPESMGDLSSLEDLAAEAQRFEIEPTAAQRAVLDDLQALISFVEGYGAVVVAAAAAGKLPNLSRIEEATTRRRAEKGPGEQFLAQLIGLDLKPSDLRSGRAFCDAVLAARGQNGLDRAWQDAAALPQPQELTDPSRWLLRMAAAEAEAGFTPELADIELDVPDDLGDA